MPMNAWDLAYATIPPIKNTANPHRFIIIVLFFANLHSRHDVIDLFQSDSPNVESETTKEENVSSSSKFEPLVEAFFSAPLLFFNTDMVSEFVGETLS